MSKFKLPPSKPRVDERALAEFSSGAETHAVRTDTAPTPLPPERPVVSPSLVEGRPEKATESFLVRLTPSQMGLLNLVFEQTNVKSKQKLVEGILIPELERRAAALGK